MAYVATLLVEGDSQVAWRIIRRLESVRIPRPQLAERAEDALEWVIRQPFGLCLLDYDLPDMNGVDLTVLLRQRRPEMPIYMMSAAKSEAAAVAAFRAGVSDYIPKDAQLFDSVAKILQRYSETEAKLAEIPPAHAIPDDMPRELLEPSYQNRLRVIGRQLDLNQYRLASIFEVEGGFLVRALPEHGRSADALEFPNRDFLHFITEAYRNRGHGERRTSASALFPSGYEDFMRAIGAALDRHGVDAVTISEFTNIVVVGGNLKFDTPEMPAVGGLQWVLKAEDITQILDAGYQRRRSGKQYKTGSVLERIFGRPDSTHAASA